MWSSEGRGEGNGSEFSIVPEDISKKVNHMVARSIHLLLDNDKIINGIHNKRIILCFLKCNVMLLVSNCPENLCQIER